MTKRCSRCGEPKPPGDFPRNRTRRDGLSERCRACKNADGAALRARKREAAALESAGRKTCSKCGVPKSLSEFYPHRHSPDRRHGGCKDGRHGQCKDCMKIAGRERYKTRGRNRAERKGLERKAIARRQSLFHIPQNGGHRYETAAQRHMASLPAKHWYRIQDPVMREEARLEYERLLQPPPLLSSDGKRLDV